jgi:hypothetical protein
MSADSIARCKVALPMPELWHKLGLRGDPKKSCFSPFRENKNTPAFSVFQKHNQWFYKDQAIPDIHGDEIGLIELATGKETGEAIRFYHELAGIPMPETKSNPTKLSKNSLGKLVKIYDYQDANGNLVHQTLRFEPKRFLQRRPAAEGMHAGGKVARCDKRSGKWWIWTLDGIEPVLFRLPRLIKAPIDQPVFLCEGEKDVEVLEVLGPVATTAPMGAGKWRESYTKVLEKRDVIICPDDDDAGKRHVEIVAGSLLNRAARIRVLNVEKLWPRQSRNGASDRKIDVAEIIRHFIDSCTDDAK